VLLRDHGSRAPFSPPRRNPKLQPKRIDLLTPPSFCVPPQYTRKDFHETHRSHSPHHWRLRRHRSRICTQICRTRQPGHRDRSPRHAISPSREMSIRGTTLTLISVGPKRDVTETAGFGSVAPVGPRLNHGRSLLATDATSQVGVVAYGPTPDMQRRIVDRIEPKTLFPFGAPGEGPRACGTIHWAPPVIDTGSRFWFSPHSVG
jgi:hypothetical protein